MTPQSTPMRWPAAWKDAAMLRLLDGSGIDCLLEGPEPVGEAVRNARIICGEWPGVQSSHHAGAGPTGEPWVDSNGWEIVWGTRPAQPGVIVAGTNPVNVDAVCTAMMGFDPMADRGKAPFETCDSTLRLAEDIGLGSRDLRRIEVVGARVEDVRFDFRKVSHVG